MKRDNQAQVFLNPSLNPNNGIFHKFKIWIATVNYVAIFLYLCGMETIVTQETLEIAGKEYRFYKKGDILFPSVTTVLNHAKGDQWYVKWCASIGEEAAIAKGKYARNRGTLLHELIERFLVTKVDYYEMLNVCVEEIDNYTDEEVQGAYSLWKTFHDSDFQSTIKSIHSYEIPLHSYINGTQGFAGKYDMLMCDHDNKLVLLDFKTSGKPKKAEWITDYKEQLSAYWFALKKNGIEIDRATNVIMNDETSEVQLFTIGIEEAKTRYGDFKNKVRQFYDEIITSNKFS